MAYTNLGASHPTPQPLFRVWNATGKALTWIIYPRPTPTATGRVVTLPAKWTKQALYGYTIFTHPPTHMVKIAERQYVVVDQVKVRTDWPF